MTAVPNVRLSLSGKPENVLLVRQALTGLAETIGLDPVELNDLSTAVSEACNNVVQHAYGGDHGLLEVDVAASSPASVQVSVRDRGVGIHSNLEAEEEPTSGIGLAVIRALARSVELRDLPGEGTEVLMDFSTAHARALEASEQNGARPATLETEELANTMTMTVSPASLARGVLPRILCALAARSRFSTDRISDAELLADVLVARTATSMHAESVSVAIGISPRMLELRMGPLEAGRAEALLRDSAVDGLGSMLDRLADGHEISRDESGDLLTLRFAART